jgi:hypothetical protein
MLIMPKSRDPGAPAPHPETDSAAQPQPTAAERAKAIIEARLAQKKHGPPGASGGKAGGIQKPGKGGWSPPPIRPGGRGRRG